MSYDALIAVIAVVTFVGAFGLAGLTWWMRFWTGLALWLSICELISRLTEGLTMSQDFWKYSLTHHLQAVGLALMIALGGIGLAVHLLWKLLIQWKIIR